MIHPLEALQRWIGDRLSRYLSQRTRTRSSSARTDHTLLMACLRPGDVLLIESNHDPAIVNTDVQDRQTLFEFFELWPLNAIVVHAVLLGFVACMAFAPIFGRPKELPTAAASDFGRHVAALGRLLGGTGAREYAVQKLQQYRRRAQRGSGKSRLATTRPAHPTPPNTPA